MHVLEEQHMIESGFGGAHPRQLTQTPEPDPSESGSDSSTDPDPPDPPDPPSDSSSEPEIDPNQLRRRLAMQVISSAQYISFENLIGQDDTTHYNLDVTGKSWVFQFNIRFGDIASSDQSVFLYADEGVVGGQHVYRMWNIYADQNGANTKWFYLNTRTTPGSAIIKEMPIREWFIPRGYNPDGEATLNGVTMTVNVVFMDYGYSAPYWHIEYHVPSMGNSDPLMIGQIPITPDERMQSVQHVRVGPQNPFTELSGMTIMTEDVDPSFFVANRLAYDPNSWPY